jgi:hypothetical protein
LRAANPAPEARRRARRRTVDPFRSGGVFMIAPAGPAPEHSQAEAAADARRQRVKLYSEYCEPFATKQMRPDRLARRVKTPLWDFLIVRRMAAFS